ncbi:MAG: UDP-N-acetylglucosamine diphosphorylase/glucosamine-1-phosphate N-acetyltransferase [bacterium]|jgi:UDP-N-acetylglucosamine diphosphorylase/glucosamine-1-phosphate N-acetyltransferase
MKAVILAGGKSKRLAPFSHTRPKSMIFLAGEYILETTLKQLKEAGVQDVYIVVDHYQQMIRDHFHYGKAFGLKIEYLIQKEPGIGNAIALAETVIEDDPNFLLVYGDTLSIQNPYIHFLKNFKVHQAKAMATITHPSIEGEYGNIYINHEFKINKFIEKPDNPRLSNYVLAGSYILPRTSFQTLKEENYDMVSLLQKLISENELAASLWENDWIDITRPWHILSANQMKMDQWKQSIISGSAKIEANVQINGIVHIGDHVHISSGTTINGPCYIGSNVYIGNNCLIRNHSSIGASSTVGYGTEIKNSVLFGNTRVGRLSFIGDSVLGSGVQLGSGTVTSNYKTTGGTISCKTPTGELDTKLTKLGAFIGDNAIVGTGHTIGPGVNINENREIEDKISIQE